MGEGVTVSKSREWGSSRNECGCGHAMGEHLNCRKRKDRIHSGREIR